MPKKFSIDQPWVMTLIAMIRQCDPVPSYPDIMKALDLPSLSMVSPRLDWLIRKGYLKPRQKGRRRALVLTEEGERLFPEFVVKIGDKIPLRDFGRTDDSEVQPCASEDKGEEPA